MATITVNLRPFRNVDNEWTPEPEKAALAFQAVCSALKEMGKFEREVDRVEIIWERVFWNSGISLRFVFRLHHWGSSHRYSFNVQVTDREWVCVNGMRCREIEEPNPLGSSTVLAGILQKAVPFGLRSAAESFDSFRDFLLQEAAGYQTQSQVLVS